MSSDRPANDPEVRFTQMGLGPFAARAGPRSTIDRRAWDQAALDATVSATDGPRPLTSAQGSGPALPRITWTLADPGDVAGPSEDSELRARELIGEGGMGRVFAAEQRSLTREVAVKVLREGAHAADVGALVREGRIAGRLEHPRIVPIHALGVDAQGAPVLVMKRVRGVSWAALLRDENHPAWTPLLARAEGDRLVAQIELLSAVCDALDCAHDAGVVHCDVKPENVLVGSWGETYLTDWGVASTEADRAADSPHRIVGTPAYMAPELVEASLGPVTPATDVYLLGATLHEVLTGAPRHPGPTLFAALAAACESAPHAYGPEVPAELAALVNRACAREPSARPRSAGDFRRALQEHLRHRGSIRLSDQAEEKLRSLRRSLADERADAASSDALAIECRFGFFLALREWSENAPAKDGLAECLTLLIEHEVARGRASEARALLGQLPHPPPALIERVESVERSSQREQVQRARDRLEAAERDLSVDAGRRTRITAAMMVFIAGVGGWAASRATLTPRDLVVLQAIVSASTLLLILLFQRRGTNRANRQLAWSVMIVNAGMLFQRLIALARGGETAHTLQADWVLMASCTGVIALFSDRRFFWCTAILALGALSCVLWPSAMSAILMVSSTLTLGVAAYVAGGVGQSTEPAAPT